MRDHRQYRDAQAHGHALGHAAGHAQPGEAARPLAERHRLQGVRRQAGLGQQFIGHRQEAFRVLLGALVFADGDLQPPVGDAQKGHAAPRRRGFQSQQV